MSYFINGYSVGLDHSPVQVEICTGQENIKKSPLKWNITRLKGEVVDQLRHMWATLPSESFFFKTQEGFKTLQDSKHSENKGLQKEELDLRAKLETTTTNLHEDVYNEGK